MKGRKEDRIGIKRKGRERDLERRQIREKRELEGAKGSWESARERERERKREVTNNRNERIRGRERREEYKNV